MVKLSMHLPVLLWTAVSVRAFVQLAPSPTLSQPFASRRPFGSGRVAAVTDPRKAENDQNGTNNKISNDLLSDGNEFRPSFVTSADTSSTMIEVADAASEEKDDQTTDTRAATRTVNERLLAELEQAAQQEKYGRRSEFSDKLPSWFVDSISNQKTDAERQAAIAEARNLNGINPAVTGVASAVALVAAYGLWQATTTVGVFLATHTPGAADTDWYVVARASAVVRNVAVGLTSLAAGFCGVTGLGLALLTGRVAVGVVTGELDPTPLPSANGADGEPSIELGQVWNSMQGKKQKDLFDP